MALLGTAPTPVSADSCDPEALRGAFRMSIHGSAGETEDYVGSTPGDESVAPRSMQAVVPVDLLGFGAPAYLARYLLSVPEEGSPAVEYRVFTCAGGRWEVVPLLLAGKRATRIEVDSDDDTLTPAGGHIARARRGAPRAYLSWDGAALREARRPLRPLSRVDGLYVTWSCKQDTGLAVGSPIRVVRAGKDVAKGTLTGAFRGACEAELDARAYDGGVHPGDLLEVTR